MIREQELRDTVENLLCAVRVLLCKDYMDDTEDKRQFLREKITDVFGEDMAWIE